MKRIFILNGNAKSGKNIFVQFVNQFSPSIHYSYVDNTKEAAKQYFGWNGVKSEKDRKFLAELNVLTEDYNDMPFRDVSGVVNDFINGLYDAAFLFIDARELDVIERMKRKFGAETVYVTKPNTAPIRSNFADAQTGDDYNYDYYIENTGDLNDLNELAKMFTGYILKSGSAKGGELDGCIV